MKPIVNLDELEFKDHAHGPFAGRYAPIGERIGAQLLGYNLTVCPPGKKVCPYHNHRNNEELFLILDGTGTLRFGAEEYPLRKHDLIACPPGDRSVAHQIINTGVTDLVYLAISTANAVEICEYPDSNKFGVYVDGGGLRQIFRAGSAVDYYDGEDR